MRVWMAIVSLTLVVWSCNLIAQPPPLLLISIDGFRPDYLLRTPLTHLRSLAADGVRADSLQQVFPTKTFPSHYTIVTGLYPQNHGVVANSMRDPQRDAVFSLGDRQAVGDAAWYAGEPIWNTVEQAGGIAATYFWPGSEAPIGGRRPSEWFPYDGEVPNSKRVKQVLAWLDRPAASRPDFMTLYFSAVDSAGHRAGPDSKALENALVEIDKAIGQLLHGLAERELLDRLNILVVSDHGMARVDGDRHIRLDRYLDLERVRVSAWGAAAHIWTRPEGPDAETIAAKLDNSHPRLRARLRTDLRPRYRYREHHRIADVIALADPGWMVSSSAFIERLEERVTRGAHGWDPAWLPMHGLFIGHGPAFAPGSRLPAVRSIDLYPLMARLMELTPASVDGKLRPFRTLLEAQSPTRVEEAQWHCQSQTFVARTGPDSIGLQVQRDGYNWRFALPAVPATSGTRFADSGVRFWQRGDRASITIDGQSWSNCRQQSR